MNMEAQRKKDLASVRVCTVWSRPLNSYRFADRTTRSDCLSRVDHKLRLDLLESGE
jgi:hypothetical protein